MAIEAFHDVVFPARIAFGASVTTTRKVEVIALVSGAEQRNLRQAHSRRSYDAGTGLRSLNDLRTVLAFFEARRGPLTAFRFRDPLDHSSRTDGLAVTPHDQVIGTGDGVNRRFMLMKTYGSGADAYTRPIRWPVSATMRVAVGGVEKASGEFSWDAATGEIVFAVGHVPSADAQVSAGFEFHVPVRFAVESISANIVAFEGGDIPSIPLVEVLA